jgi:hypothetical protein
MTDRINSPQSSRTPLQKEDNVLRTVPEERAFYFYAEVDTPLGVKATNLEEFVETLRRIEVSSVQFHSSRRDFANWIQMLGDERLAKQFESLAGAGLPASQLQQQLADAVRMRIEEIRRSKPTVSARSRRHK